MNATITLSPSSAPSAAPSTTTGDSTQHATVDWDHVAAAVGPIPDIDENDGDDSDDEVDESDEGDTDEEKSRRQATLHVRHVRLAFTWNHLLLADHALLALSQTYLDSSHVSGAHPTRPQPTLTLLTQAANVHLGKWRPNGRAQSVFPVKLARLLLHQSCRASCVLLDRSHLPHSRLHVRCCRRIATCVF